MSRNKAQYDRVRVDVWMLESLHNRLEKWRKANGWSKTKTIEYAVAGWLNDRDMEDKAHGLDKTS